MADGERAPVGDYADHDRIIVAMITTAAVVLIWRVFWLDSSACSRRYHYRYSSIQLAKLELTSFFREQAGNQAVVATYRDMQHGTYMW